MRERTDIDWHYGLRYQQMWHDTYVLLKQLNEERGWGLRPGQCGRMATELIEANGWPNPYW